MLDFEEFQIVNHEKIGNVEDMNDTTLDQKMK